MRNNDARQLPGVFAAAHLENSSLVMGDREVAGPRTAVSHLLVLSVVVSEGRGHDGDEAKRRDA
jgi:hypothetical protein